MQALLLLLSSRHIFQIVSSSMVAFLFIHRLTTKKSSSTLSICSCYCIIISLKAMPLPIQINYFFLLHSFPSSSSIIINELKKTLCILSHGDMTQFSYFYAAKLHNFSFFSSCKKQQQQDP